MLESIFSALSFPAPEALGEPLDLVQEDPEVAEAPHPHPWYSLQVEVDLSPLLPSLRLAFPSRQLLHPQPSRVLKTLVIDCLEMFYRLGDE